MGQKSDSRREKKNISQSRYVVQIGQKSDDRWEKDISQSRYVVQIGQKSSDVSSL